MIEKHGEQSRVDFENVAYVAEIHVSAFASRAIEDLFRGTAFGMHDISINARQSNRVNPAMTQCGEDVCVDLAGKDHLRHFERFVVCNAAPLDDYLLDTHLLCQFAQLLAATVNDADANPDLMKEGEFFAQRNQMIAILSDFAGELNDERLPLEALNVRQRFTQEIESQLASNFAGVGH